MNSLIFNWILILIIGFALSRYLKQNQLFISGIISLIIGSVIAYGIHVLWVPSGDFLWAMIAVGHASYWAGFFSSIKRKK